MGLELGFFGAGKRRMWGFVDSKVKDKRRLRVEV